MHQTPAHTVYNPSLLEAMPPSKSLVEVGCSTGALAGAYRKLHPKCHYLGIEIDPTYAEAAKESCINVIVGDIEKLLKDQAHLINLKAEGYMFGDCL
jgi:tRNA G46 methylase TrmB